MVKREEAHAKDAKYAKNAKRILFAFLAHLALFA
jgi:hypothetical protein